ncbi:hypothetical protein KPH14_013067 [Odynerus spinipes]|uniref:Uncharacterized protein n=1 Tax=Odynerus spinipes TaxID=1348599 RepID=A0AAD9R7W1_9HYME|nr:hypothetical protein KPH14_013067 [Odynerus spinipes]
MKEFGIGAIEQYLESKFRTILSAAFKKTLVALAKVVTGTVSKTLAKVGLRVGIAKVVGFAVSRITTQLLVIAGTFATGVGILVSAIQIIALLLDLAFLAGWDPGNYKSEVDIAVYESIANFFTYSKQHQDAVKFRCDYLLLSLYRNDDATEKIDTSQGEGTATEKPSATGETTNGESTKAATLAATATDDKGKSVSPFDPTKLYQRNLALRREATTSSDAILRNGANGGTSTTAKGATTTSTKEKKKTEIDQVLNVDELISRPRWFNKQWPQCFAASEERVNIVDERDTFNLVYGYFFLGHLKYNSFGQRLQHDADENVDLNDETLADVMIETDYRDLLTTSAKRDVNTQPYNYRVAINSKLLRYLFAAVLALATLYVLSSVKKTSRVVDFLIFTLITLIVIASIIFVVKLILPLDDAFAAKYTSAMIGLDGQEDGGGGGVNGLSKTTGGAYKVGGRYGANGNDNTSDVGDESTKTTAAAHPITILDLTSRFDAFVAENL